MALRTLMDRGSGTADRRRLSPRTLRSRPEAIQRRRVRGERLPGWRHLVDQGQVADFRASARQLMTRSNNTRSRDVLIDDRDT